MTASTDAWLQFFGRLHPFLLHVPIGALVALVCLELVARLPRVPRLAPGVRGVLLALTTLAAIVTASSGWLLGEEFGDSERAFVWHRVLGIAFTATLVLASLAALFRKGDAYGALLFLAVALVVPTGHFGATLTHGADFLTEPLRSRSTPPAVEAAQPGSPAPPTTTYATAIAPIFEARCGLCHGERKQKGELALHEPRALLAGGYSGPVLVPGDAAASELVRRLRLPLEHEDHMPPPSKPQPTEEEIAAVESWIEAGAPFGDASAAGDLSEPPPSPESETDGSSSVDEPSPSDASETASVEHVGPPAAPIAALRANHVHVETLDPVARLLWIDFTAAPDTDDAFALEQLEPLRNFVLELSLAGTAITDRILPALAAMPHLERLDLSGTTCTSESLSALRHAPVLATLNLTGTDVDDLALEALSAMPSLRTAYVWDTAVTLVGIAALTRAHPELIVVIGTSGPGAPLEVEAPPRLVAAPSLELVDSTRPVSGN